MRVGVVGPFHPDSLADNVFDSLRRMGHEPFALGAGRPGPFSGRMLGAAFDVATRAHRFEAASQRILVSRARRHRVDVVLNTDARLAPAAVKGFKALGCPVGLWFPDHVGNIGRQFMFLAPYDCVFVKEPLLADRARALLGTRIFYVPEACNPSWHTPPADADFVAEIAVVGNSHPWRFRLLERMISAGLPIRMYGGPPPPWLRSPAVERFHTRRYVARQDKARVFRSAAAVLNALHPAEMTGVNCRLFEAAGCGGVVLSEWRPELPQMFEPGTEVLAFTSFDELVDRARWALDNADAGRALGDRASRRAHAEHTYEHRLATILDALTGATSRP
jgi:spore maturation protein CgeB